MATIPAGSVVAVIGSGAMGAGIAQVAASAGHTVKLYDTRPEAVSKAIADIGAVYRKLADKQKMTAADADAATARLKAVHSLGDVADAALVVEAIVEKLDVKRPVCRPGRRGVRRLHPRHQYVVDFRHRDRRRVAPPAAPGGHAFL
jgi:3-hydroxybutyryl-CoA dehydrogenase